MPFSYRELVFGGKTFCCCLPVRMGVIAMSSLGILLGGILSIVLWFEVASTVGMTRGERAGFVVAGLVESFLFVASILGFVGAVVRKQSFVQIYAYVIYVHFIINIGVAGYTLYLVTHFSANATVKACQETIQNEQAKEQCTGLLKVARGVYFAVAAFVLLVEFYGAVIVTRYMNQVKTQKHSARVSRLVGEEAFSLVPRGEGRYSSVPSEHNLGDPVYTGSGQEFDPYEEIREPVQEIRRSSTYDGVPHVEDVGYGGGSWTHSEISAEEKEWLKDRGDSETGPPQLTVATAYHSVNAIKSQIGPSFPMPEVTDDLPQYTFSAPPNTSPAIG